MTPLDARADSAARRRIRRRVVAAVVLVLLAGLLVAHVVFVYLDNSAVERAVGRLRPGLTTAEVRQVLADVPHFDMVSNGRGSFLIDGDGEFVNVMIAGDLVDAVNHVPETGSTWDRLRHTWDRHRRAWDFRRRARDRAAP